MLTLPPSVQLYVATQPVDARKSFKGPLSAGATEPDFYRAPWRVPLSPSTLDDWTGGAAHVLQPIALHILQQIVAGAHISLDDTPVRVLDPKVAHGVKRGHIWSLVGQGAVAYLYTPSWIGKPIRELLGDFAGLLQSDGYAGLHKLFEKKLNAPTRAGCMAHARRRFVQALEAGDARAAVPLTVIKKLYEIEPRATQDGVDVHERLVRRQTESHPLMEQLHKVLEALKAQAPPKPPWEKPWATPCASGRRCRRLCPMDRCGWSPPPGSPRATEV